MRGSSGVTVHAPSARPDVSSRGVLAPARGAPLAPPLPDRATTADRVRLRGGGAGGATMLDRDYPGRTFVVIPVGLLDRPPAQPPDIDPDYQKFDRALKTQVRPILVPLQRLPFRDFRVEEFLGRTLTTCRGAAGCRSVFKGSTLTLGQMAD